MAVRTVRWLSVAVGAMLCAALLAGLFLPVYADEIGWRFQERAGFDGVDKMFSEVCGFSMLVRPPWFMMPVRWYSSLFNGAFADPFWIRISGILYALIWVGLAVVLVRRTTADRQLRAIGVTIGLGVLALGTTPLLLVWSRPEQPIILAVVGALLFAFADGTSAPHSISTGRQAWTRSLAIFVVSCIALSYHVKGLFLLPLMLACLAFASRGAKAHLPRIVSALLILVTTASATSYWRQRLECPENAVIAKAYGAQNLASTITQVSSPGDVATLLGKLMSNISVFNYVTGVGPRVKPLSGWLQYGQVDEQTSFYWFLALLAAWGLALIVAAVAVAFAAARDWRERRADPRTVLALTTFGVAIAWSATQTYRNVYESKFVLPLYVLAILLALSTVRSARLKAILPAPALAIGLFALVSPIAIGAIYGPSLARAAEQQGRVRDQPQSVSVFGYAGLEADILGAAKLCKIPDPAHSRAVMVDDVTYFAFIRTKLPQHEQGVISGWNGDIADPIGYLRRRRSDGAVVNCKLLSPDLRSRAKSVGRFCCLGPPNW